MRKNNLELFDYLNVNLSALVILERINDPSESWIKIKKDQIFNRLNDEEGLWVNVFENKELNSIISKIEDSDFLSELNTIVIEEIKRYYSGAKRSYQQFFSNSTCYYSSEDKDFDKLLQECSKHFVLPDGTTICCSDVGFANLSSARLIAKRKQIGENAEREKAEERRKYEEKRAAEIKKGEKIEKGTLFACFLFLGIVIISVIMSFVCSYYDSEEATVFFFIVGGVSLFILLILSVIRFIMRYL